MSAQLFCRVGPLAGSKCEISREATIGSGSGNSLVLDDPSLAPQQARIRFDDKAGCYFLEDLSGGGTALDGLAVQGRMRLGRLHVITFPSGHDFFFHWQGEKPPDLKETIELGDLGLSEEDLQEPVSSGTVLQTSPHIPAPPSFQPGQRQPQAESTDRTHAAKTVGDHAGGVSVPAFLKGKSSPPSDPSPQATEEPTVKLVLEIDLPDGTKTYPLAQGENVVGRSPNCSIFVEHHAFSRRHAAVIVDSAAVKIRDLGSTNKTYVEGKPVRQETEIAPGTPLAFAKIKARIQKEET